MIGVFDSGVGGLGVFSEMRRRLPDADLVYLADHSHAPYGVRSLEDVRQRCEQIAAWMIAEGCGVVVIACNTASAAALHPLRRHHPDVGFVGMEPALKPAAKTTRSGKVGVVATAATFQGELFGSVVDRFGDGVEVVTAACPQWVELVEAGILGGWRAHRAVSECLAPLAETGVDVIVLACTHYPALAPVITEVMGPGVTIIDPAPAVARQGARVAHERGAADGKSLTRLLSTGDSTRLSEAATRAGIEGEVSLLRLP